MTQGQLRSETTRTGVLLIYQGKDPGQKAGQRLWDEFKSKLPVCFDCTLIKWVPHPNPSHTWNDQFINKTNDPNVRWLVAFLTDDSKRASNESGNLLLELGYWMGKRGDRSHVIYSRATSPPSSSEDGHPLLGKFLASIAAGVHPVPDAQAAVTHFIRHVEQATQP